MSGIVKFLQARYEERRTAIEAMPRGPWEWATVETDAGVASSLGSDDGEVLGSGDEEGYRSWIDKHDAFDGYLAIVQPEELLADLDAKLAVLDEHQDVNDGDCGTCIDGQWGYPTHGGSSPQTHPCRTLRHLAVPFAAHPDYDERWRP